MKFKLSLYMARLGLGKKPEVLKDYKLYYEPLSGDKALQKKISNYQKRIASR